MMYMEIWTSFFFSVLDSEEENTFALHPQIIKVYKNRALKSPGT